MLVPLVFQFQQVEAEYLAAGVPEVMPLTQNIEKLMEGLFAVGTDQVMDKVGALSIGKVC